MKIYTKSAPFKYKTMFKFHCPNCSHDYSFDHDHEETIEVSAQGGYPSDRALFNKANESFQWRQQNLLKALGKKRSNLLPADVSKSFICPKCGFKPNFLINRGSTLFLIIGLLVITLGTLIPVITTSVGSGDIIPTVAGSLACLTPVTLLEIFLFRALNPNRKLILEAHTEGQTIESQELPEIIFGPTEPAIRRPS
jgi:predicted RNA-binding Zn-ribbon protein involved in translation (DUF1610 family)